MEELLNSPTSSIGLLITNGGTPVASTAISVDIELLTEQDGTRQQKRVTVSKGITDGFFTFQFKAIFPDIQVGNLYSYCISSGGDTIDTVDGRIRLREESDFTSLSRQVETFKRQIQQSIEILKKEIEDARRENQTDNAGRSERFPRDSSRDTDRNRDDRPE